MKEPWSQYSAAPLGHRPWKLSAESLKVKCGDAGGSGLGMDSNAGT